MARVAANDRVVSVLGGLECNCLQKNRCMRRHIVSTHQPQLHIRLGPEQLLHVKTVATQPNPEHPTTGQQNFAAEKHTASTPPTAQHNMQCSKSSCVAEQKHHTHTHISNAPTAASPRMCMRIQTRSLTHHHPRQSRRLPRRNHRPRRRHPRQNRCRPGRRHCRCPRHQQSPPAAARCPHHTAQHSRQQPPQSSQTPAAQDTHSSTRRKRQQGTPLDGGPVPHCTAKVEVAATSYLAQRLNTTHTLLAHQPQHIHTWSSSCGASPWSSSSSRLIASSSSCASAASSATCCSQAASSASVGRPPTRPHPAAPAPAAPKPPAVPIIIGPVGLLL